MKQRMDPQTHTQTIHSSMSATYTSMESSYLAWLTLLQVFQLLGHESDVSLHLLVVVTVLAVPRLHLLHL